MIVVFIHLCALNSILNVEINLILSAVSYSCGTRYHVIVPYSRIRRYSLVLHYTNLRRYSQLGGGAFSHFLFNMCNSYANYHELEKNKLHTQEKTCTHAHTHTPRMRVGSMEKLKRRNL